MNGIFEIAEETYYTVTTEQDLIDSITTDWDDIEDILEDLMDGKTWTEYKNSF
jgi:hypothetical protein